MPCCTKGMTTMHFAKRLTAGTALLVALSLASSLLLVSACNQSQQQEETRYFVALGDSVSSGFGLYGYSPPYTQNYPLEGRHTSLFFEYLRELGLVDDYVNLATSGHTTTDLLEFLRTADQETLRQFASASVVTLNIGGNNLLSPLFDYFPDIDIGAMQGAWQAVIGLFGGGHGQGEGPNLDALVAGIMGASWLLSFLLGADVFAALNDAVSVLTGNFSQELEIALENGAAVFAEEFSQIVDWLVVHAPRAHVIVNTVYNPIPGEFWGIRVPVAERAGEYLAIINSTIFAKSEAAGFTVIDIHSYFDSRPELMRLDLDFSSDDFSLDFIHPSAEGHLFITELHRLYFGRGR